MPDNTGRDARVKKEDMADADSNRKVVIDALSKLIANASLSNDNAKHIGFVMPAVDDQPEKFVRLCDLERSLGDMALIHEIAINERFSLKPTGPDADPLRYQVLTQMKEAYFELLREKLSQEPPCFAMVIQVLLDVKETFKSLLKGNNDQALERILFVLDENKLLRLAEQHGVQLLEPNCHFVLNIMAMACSPARDAEIAALRLEKDPILMLRGIMEVLDKMKLDMANYLLASARSEFVRYSIEYEKKKFVELQAFCGNDFPNTVAWLKRNRPTNVGKLSTSEEGADRGMKMVRLMDGQVQMPEYFINAFLELIKPDVDHPLPELLKLDSLRLEEMKGDALRLAMCATIMQLTCACVTAFAHSTKRRDLAAKLDILSKDYPKKSSLKETLESLWLQVLVTIEKHEQEENAPPIGESGKQALKAQIIEIDGKQQTGVHGIVWKKLLGYIKDVVGTEREMDVTFPPSYHDYRQEIFKMSVTFKKIIAHTFGVHGEYFLKQHD